MGALPRHGQHCSTEHGLVERRPRLAFPAREREMERLRLPEGVP